MLEALIEAIVELVGELLLQVLGQVVLELGFGSLAHSFRRGRAANPVLAGVGIALLGTLTGLAASLLLPRRVLPRSPVPGLGLLVSPLLAGGIMRALGDWRRARGGDPTLLATFWGGALFAFAVAVVRWWMVGRSS